MTEIWLEGGLLVAFLIILFAFIRGILTEIRTELRDIASRVNNLEKNFWRLRGEYNGFHCPHGKSKEECHECV